MNLCTRKIENWLSAHPKAREWLWFVVLWCGGLLTVLAMAYPIKWIIKNI